MFNFVNIISQSLTKRVMSLSNEVVSNTQKIANNTGKSTYTIIISVSEEIKTEVKNPLEKDREKIRMDNIKIGRDMRKAIARYGE
ncbi:hypothetical protein ACFOU0_06150 [Salinicoccus sesuvii]|uniref:Uncharacterized protein n=1 Tax=Salinicoccus sesuvii TaxID=868281 RepID=A0ABV7N7G1_9STAP